MIDDVITGVLVEVIVATGRRLGAVAKAAAAMSHKGSDDLSIARWFDTYQLVAAPPELLGLTAAQADQLAECLQGNEAQAILHELLAARLTDAPEADADRLRDLFELTLTAESADLFPVTSGLFDYYNGEIAKLAGRLEGAEPALLAQIRSDAFASRMIATLNAIERHAASLSSRP